MFINIGNDIVINTKEIVAILDVNDLNFKKNKILFDKFNIKKLDNLIDGDTRSLIITDNEIYRSSISTITLINRTN